MLEELLTSTISTIFFKKRTRKSGACSRLISSFQADVFVLRSDTQVAVIMGVLWH